MCYYNSISNILILYVLIQNIISIQSDPPFAIMRIAQQIIARAWRVVLVIMERNVKGEIYKYVNKNVFSPSLLNKTKPSLTLNHKCQMLCSPCPCPPLLRIVLFICKIYLSLSILLSGAFAANFNHQFAIFWKCLPPSRAYLSSLAFRCSLRPVMPMTNTI